MIRPYVEQDLDELVDVWYRASLIAHPFLSPEFLDEERLRIADKWLPLAETVVAICDGRVVGFLSLVGNEVGGLFVDPDFQRRGIGRSLLDWAQQSRTCLELGVFEANQNARRFYEAYGFEVVSRGVHEETGHMELRLSLDTA